MWADVGIWHALWYAALSWHMDTMWVMGLVFSSVRLSVCRYVTQAKRRHDSAGATRVFTWNLERTIHTQESNNWHETLWRDFLSYYSGGSRIYHMGRKRRGGGTNLLFGKIFAENCIKMKKNGLRSARSATELVHSRMHARRFLDSITNTFWRHT